MLPARALSSRRRREENASRDCDDETSRRDRILSYTRRQLHVGKCRLSRLAGLVNLSRLVIRIERSRQRDPICARILRLLRYWPRCMLIDKKRDFTNENPKLPPRGRAMEFRNTRLRDARLTWVARRRRRPAAALVTYS